MQRTELTIIGVTVETVVGVGDREAGASSGGPRWRSSRVRHFQLAAMPTRGLC